LKSNDLTSEINYKVYNLPSNPFVIQEYIDYIAIYRVIVINGKALPYSFIDTPTKNNWKVSVSLNYNKMKFVKNPDKNLLELAEKPKMFSIHILKILIKVFIL